VAVQIEEDKNINPEKDNVNGCGQAGLAAYRV
jgi:hypothetical protein